MPSGLERRVSRVCLLAALLPICGACSLPALFLNAAFTPIEYLTPIGDDASRLFVIVTRAPAPNPLSVLAYETTLPPPSFDVQSIDYATGVRTDIRGNLGAMTLDADPAYYYASPGMLALADDHWLVSATTNGAMSIWDIASSQEYTLLDGLFRLTGVRLAAVHDDRAIVLAPDFLLVVDLATRAQTWFPIADLGFSPIAAAIEGSNVALLGKPLFDPATDAAGTLEDRYNLYIVPLGGGAPRLLRGDIAFSPSYGLTQNIRFDAGRVHWLEFDPVGGGQRVLSIDSAGTAERTEADFPGYVSDPASTTFRNVYDFGAPGVLFQQSAIGGNPFDLVTQSSLTVRVLTPDGRDRELEAFNLSTFLPYCPTAFNPPAEGATFDGRLLTTFTSPCGVFVFDAATDAGGVVRPN